VTRKLLVIAMVLPYLGLCVYDCWHGRIRTGVAAGLLAVVNFVLYW
jgi:hypothetical protein